MSDGAVPDARPIVFAYGFGGWVLLAIVAIVNGVVRTSGNAVAAVRP